MFNDEYGLGRIAIYFSTPLLVPPSYKGGIDYLSDSCFQPTLATFVPSKGGQVRQGLILESTI